jgi:uncharacterized protein (TIGR00725 family)
MTTRRKVIGVMGAGEGATDADIALAHELGKLIGARGWVLLSGGRNVGVMEAVNTGAKAAGGLTVGIAPRTADQMSDAVDIVIVTDMGGARNNINVLSSDVVISCGTGGPGTASEIALALKAKKHVVLLNESEAGQKYFKTLGAGLIHVATTPAEAVQIAARFMETG